MIGRKSTRIEEEEIVEPKGFDDFELRLGDMMRGERATMGKSLLDVQRELRIKASYIAAIENSDPSAFDTQGFIAGYVRSYARYLGMDPDKSFAAFCEESGFAVAHGMSSQASASASANSGTARRSSSDEAASRLNRDPFTSPNTPFVPVSDGMFGQLEPRALGSTLVLLALISAIGYGGWTVLRQIQQVQVVPVEQAPVVLADLDPLDGAVQRGGPDAPGSEAEGTTRADALDRLYRPQPLDVPVMVARDAPISTLNPDTLGAFRNPTLPSVDVAEAALPDAQAPAAQASDGAIVATAPQVPQVFENLAPRLRLVAVGPAWVRVSAADGSVLYEGIMQNGQSYLIPQTEEPPTLRTGASSEVFIALADQPYGPVGPRGSVTSNVVLSLDAVTERYELADLNRHENVFKVVAELSGAAIPPENN